MNLNPRNVVKKIGNVVIKKGTLPRTKCIFTYRNKWMARGLYYELTKPCLEMNNSSTEKCRFCMGTGNVTVELGGDEKEISRCINCDGVGTLTCTTCQGSGIQPRYLDRRYVPFYPSFASFFFFWYLELA